jgi:hypothetical protein
VPAARRRDVAVERGVGVEHLEVVERPMLQAGVIGGRILLRRAPAGFIAPCLPTKTDKLPSGSQWLHEIKHDDVISASHYCAPKHA